MRKKISPKLFKNKKRVIRIVEGGLLGILYVKSRYSISQLFFDAKFSNPIESTINEELVYVMEERHVYVIYIKY